MLILYAKINSVVHYKYRFKPFIVTFTVSLSGPIMFLQTTVLMANVQTLASAVITEILHLAESEVALHRLQLDIGS